MKIKRLREITRGEKLLYAMTIFDIFRIILVQVFCGASVGHLNMNVEILKYNIEL